jgi:hypothetical protein
MEIVFIRMPPRWHADIFTGEYLGMASISMIKVPLYI